MSQEARAAALQAAVAFHSALGDLKVQPGTDRNVAYRRGLRMVQDTAENWAPWIAGTAPVRLTLLPGPITHQTTGETRQRERDDMTQLRTYEQFRLTVDTEDERGNDTPDTVTWAFEPGAAEDVIRIDADPNGRSATFVATGMGSTTIRATVDGTDLTATHAIDVIAGEVAVIKFVEGEITRQPNPEPQG